MVRPRPAVHRTILVVDVEGFGDQHRTNPHQVAVRDGVYRALRWSFDKVAIAWSDCYHEDRGDGVFVLVPPEVPKGLFVEALPLELAAALREHNTVHCREERIRLRMALHAGEVNYDDHGATAAAINLAFRLLDAPPFKAALAESPGVLALIASSWFFDEVVRHCTAVDAAAYRPVRVTAKETTTVGWICMPDHPHQLDGATTPMTDGVPHQLPIAAHHFAGRRAELEALTNRLEHVPERGGMVVVSAIDGTAGIGKTALAVHWAHQVADRFPDGQLYVNLRGFDQTRSAMTPAEAVRGFFDAFEVAPERIPVSLDAQTALYRSLLARRKVLVVLDNAHNVDQIRPLLPGSAGCLVVVTSRNRLTSLVAAEGAYPLTLDLLTAKDARELLVGHLGADRVAAEPQSVEEIIALCARLPLALSIVAARAATHPKFGLAVLAGELRAAHGGLDAFDGGDIATNVRAVFSWSYHQLSAAAAKTFRLLGLHPGPDISAAAAASLAGIPPAQARPLLAECARAHLVKEHAPGRFALHDLLRVYAAELTLAVDTDAERSATLCRMLDHYLYTGHAAAILTYPRRPLVSLPPSPHTGVTRERLRNAEAAWAWFQAEYPVLLAVIQRAATSGHDGHAWQLACTLEESFVRWGHWHDSAATHHIALAAARRQADRRGQAHAHRGQGKTCLWLGRAEDAESHLRQALSLFEELGDLVNQSTIHIEHAWMFDHLDRHEEALDHSQKALALSERANDRFGEARALNNVGWFHALLGDYHQALTDCQRSLAVRQELADRRGEANTLDSIGFAHHHLGNHEQAIAYYEQSLALKRELGERYGEATTLSHLGDTHEAIGAVAEACDAWQQALRILDDLSLVLRASRGYPTADQIHAKLHQFDSG
jgi:tetratricopeptide (TPR) repeat protein